MKKSSVLTIVISLLAIILFSTLIHNFLFFKDFQKGISNPTQADEQKAIEILNQTLDVSDYSFSFGNVLSIKQSRIIQVELINESSKKEYLIDLTKGRIIKK